MSANLVTLDIGDAFLKIAQVELKSGKPVLQTLAYERIPMNVYMNDSDEAENKLVLLIQKMLKDSKVSSGNVSIVIPDSRSYTRIIEMPLLTDKELVSAVRYQAEQFIPIKIDDANLDLQNLSEDKKNRKLTVLLVASNKSTVMKVNHIGERAGLSPISVENETSAVFNLLTNVIKVDKKVPKPLTYSLFVNFGFSGTSLSLYEISSLIILQTHGFMVGMEIFMKEIKTNFNLAEGEIEKLLFSVGFTNVKSSTDIGPVLSAPYNELVTEISRFMVGARQKYQTAISEIHLFGECAHVPGLDGKLSGSLGLPVKKFDMASFIIPNQVSEFFKHDLTLFVASIGANLP